MSNNETVETITVERPGPFGVKVGNDWYKLGQKSDLTPDRFEAGKTYQVSVWINATGKKYINKIIGSVASSPSPAAPSNGTNATPKAETTPKVSYGFDSPEKQERILRQGIFQSVIQSPTLQSLVLKKEDFVTVATEIAESFVAKVKGN